MNIKHSKYKNTGILFEILVRQITSDTLSGRDSKATHILKKYFVKTELGKEYKLYETLFKHKNLTEGKAEIIINSIIESSRNLNRGTLKRQKYNLIKEISEHYNFENLNDNQKSILKEFINAVDSTPKLKEFYNEKIQEIKNELTKVTKKVKDKVVQIKLNEVKNILLPLGKKANVGNDDLVNLLQYYSLLEELQKTNG